MDDRGARVLMGRGGRARLAKTCGTRDESHSSNLGRGQQEQAIRVDCTDPQDDGTGVARRQHTRDVERESMCSVRFLGAAETDLWAKRDRRYRC